MWITYIQVSEKSVNVFVQARYGCHERRRVEYSIVCSHHASSDNIFWAHKFSITAHH